MFAVRQCLMDGFFVGRFTYNRDFICSEFALLRICNANGAFSAKLIKKKEKMKQHKLVNQKGRLIVKGILFADEKSPQIHNQLLQNAQMIHTSTKMKVRNHVYKNSI